MVDRGIKYGQFVAKDYRNESRNLVEKETIKVISWNIERGYCLEGIIGLLKEIDADIISLQEVDVFTGRPDVGPHKEPSVDTKKQINCLEEIGIALGLNTVGAVEMNLLNGGYQCNAILSKFDFLSCGSLEHKSQPIDHIKEDITYGQYPRIGKRTAAWAIIQFRGRNIKVYSDHLEMHCGMEGRLEQLGDLLDDASLHDGPIIISGDLNTFEGGLGKLASFKRCGLSNLQWMTFGKLNETQVWNDCIFHEDAENHFIRKQFHSLFPSIAADYIDPFPHYHSTCSKFVLGLEVYSQKLDWILHKNVGEIIEFKTENNNYQHSDHKLVYVEYKC